MVGASSTSSIAVEALNFGQFTVRLVNRLTSRTSAGWKRLIADLSGELVVVDHRRVGGAVQENAPRRRLRRRRRRRGHQKRLAQHRTIRRWRRRERRRRRWAAATRRACAEGVFWLRLHRLINAPYAHKHAKQKPRRPAFSWLLALNSSHLTGVEDRGASK